MLRCLRLLGLLDSKQTFVKSQKGKVDILKIPHLSIKGANKENISTPLLMTDKGKKNWISLEFITPNQPQLHSPNWIISPDYAFNDWKSCWYLSRHHNGPIILFYIHGLVQNELLGKCFRKGHRWSLCMLTWGDFVGSGIIVLVTINL